jgi:hypothetical protein
LRITTLVYLMQPLVVLQPGKQQLWFRRLCDKVDRTYCERMLDVDIIILPG